MKKLFIFLLLLIISTFSGAIYGIINDQITYTISPEYYTKFKFIRFGIENWISGINIGTEGSPEILLNSPRIGASIVGLLATWWVGLIIGVNLGLSNLLQKSSDVMFKTALKALLITLSTTIIFCFIGYVYGKVTTVTISSNMYIPDNLLDQEKYILVGLMHNFSYLGGLVGLFIGMIYSARKR